MVLVCVAATLALLSAIFSSMPLSTDSELIYFSGIGLGALLSLLVIVSDFTFNALMIRFVLNNQAELANSIEIGHHKRTGALNIKSNHQYDISEEKIRFKRNLYLLFGGLLSIDLLILIISICSIVFVSGPSWNNFCQTLTIPFFIPIHINVLFYLLDQFKKEVLKKTGSEKVGSVKEGKATSLVEANRDLTANSNI